MFTSSIIPSSGCFTSMAPCPLVLKHKKRSPRRRSTDAGCTLASSKGSTLMRPSRTPRIISRSDRIIFRKSQTQNLNDQSYWALGFGHWSFHRDAHTPRRALNALHRLFDVLSVQIGHLRFRNLPELYAADLAGISLMRLAGSLLNAGCFPQKIRGGRRFVPQLVRAILIHGDLHRNDRTGLVARGLVELLANLLDIEPVLPQRRPHRRCRCRLPGRHLELHNGFYG